MKKTAVTKVAEFLASNPGSTREAIGKKTKLKGIELTNALKKLRKDDKVVEDYPAGEEATFSLKVEEAAEATMSTPVEVPEPDEQLPPTKKGRDVTKYSFNGNTYGKGRLVLECVRQYVAGHPKTTCKQLQETIFPNTILPRFGVVRDEHEARSLSSAGRDRFFMGESDGIKVSGKPNMVYVSNQWTGKTIQEFLKVARGLGFKIK